MGQIKICTQKVFFFGSFSIANLTKLNVLDVVGCDSLQSPPMQVCEQGTNAIKQYFQDLAMGRGKSFPAATIAVMGEKMAGKTSLIRTLQSKEKKRVFTIRRPDIGRDDATRVFNIEQVPTEDMILRFVDIGGHEVYHVTHPLTLRDSGIPLIVVNLKRYHKLSTDKEIGPIEAVRRLCFDSMSQLYISKPTLGSPILVLTHKDQFKTATDHNVIRKDFLENCERLRQRVFMEDQHSDSTSSGYLGDLTIPMFQEADIFDIGGESDDYEVFERILETLGARCKKFIKVVPAIWEMIIGLLSSISEPYIKFDNLLQFLAMEYSISKSHLVTILTYLHDCGKILWYPSVVELKAYIFPSIPDVTSLLYVLFAHDDEDRWKARLADESTFKCCDGTIVDNEEYRAMYQMFTTSGIMNAELLLHLIKSESSFSSEEMIAPALAILREFRLLYGPIKYKNNASFISPYFAVGYQSNDLSTIQNPVRIHSQIDFKGLAIPHFVYGQISVDILHDFSNDLSDDITLTENGLAIQQGDLSIKFTHDFKSRKVALEVAVEVENISEGWNSLNRLTHAIKFHAKTAWPAARMVIQTTCPHCLLRAHPHPRKEINPPWLTVGDPSLSSRKLGNCQGENKIPMCLIHPCKCFVWMAELATKYNFRTINLNPHIHYSHLSLSPLFIAMQNVCLQC